MWYFSRRSFVVGSASTLLLVTFAVSPYSPQHGIQQSSSQNTEQETPEIALARYTFWLTVFTGLLFCAATVQIIYLIRAERGSEQQRKVMAAQQTAMETQAGAMADIAVSTGASADAAREAARMTTRMLAHTHPPKLEIQDARIVVRPDNATYVEFWLWNKGKTGATVERTYIGDVVPSRLDGFDGASVQDAATSEDGTSIIGQHLAAESAMRVVHCCSSIRIADRPPVQKLPQLAPLALKPAVSAPPGAPQPRIVGWILYESEGGDRGWYEFRVDCYWSNEDSTSENPD